MAIEQYELQVRRARRAFLAARDDHDRWNLPSTERKLKKTRQELDWAVEDLRRAERRAERREVRAYFYDPADKERLIREGERAMDERRREIFRKEAARQKGVADANLAAGAAVAGGLALAALVGFLAGDD
jgi:hypothetical protein